MKSPIFSFILSLSFIAGFGVLSTENCQAKGFKFYGQSPITFGFAGDECSVDIGHVDRLAAMMVKTYRIEVEGRSGDADASALLRQIERHSELTGILIKAYQSKNKEAFRSALAEVRRSFANIEKLSSRAKASPAITDMIRSTSPLLVKVERHLDHFQTQR